VDEMPFVTPPARSRINRWVLIALPLFGIAGFTSWWLQRTYPNDATAEASRQRASLPHMRYSFDVMPREDSLTPELMVVLDKLAADCKDIKNDVEQTSQRLRSADEHLNQALIDPTGTPFSAPNYAPLSDIFAKCRPLTDAMVDDFLQNASVERNEKQAIEPNLRGVLYSLVARIQVDQEQFEELRKHYLGGVKDPLILACLLRAPKGALAYKTLSLDYFLHRKDRELSVPSAAFISNTMRYAMPLLDPIQYSELAYEYRVVCADVWQWLTQNNVERPNVIFFFVETSNTIGSLHFQAQCDLLLELDKRKLPEVSPTLKQYVASSIYNFIALTYRGSDFISEVSDSNLRKFQQYAIEAAKHLSKAWAIDPEQTILAPKLMAMERSSGCTSYSVDHWFRHSLAAAADSKLGFSEYQEAIQTKWGGSPERQAWFAEMCVSSEPMLPTVFINYATALQTRIWENAYTENLGHDLKMVKICQQAVNRLQQFSRTETLPIMEIQHLSPLIGVLWQAGDFDSLDWLMTVYVDKISCGWLHRFGVHSDEIKQFCRFAKETKSTCWREVHAAIHGDTRKLSPSDLETLELAIADASLEVPDYPEMGKILVAYQRRVELLRMLLNGEEIVFTETDLKDWYQTNPDNGDSLEFGSTIAAASLTLTQADDSTEPDDTTDVPESSIQNATEAQSLEVGYVDIRTWADHYEMLMSLPFRVDPPLAFSADVERLPEDGGSSMDAYGVSLLVGPAGGSAFVSDLKGLMFTFLPGRRGLLRDALPTPRWIEGDQDYKGILLNETSMRCNLRVETFPDGYRCFYNQTKWEDVASDLNTAGVVQLGRFSQAGFKDIPHAVTRYRVSNIRLKKLNAQSLKD